MKHLTTSGAAPTAPEIPIRMGGVVHLDVHPTRRSGSTFHAKGAPFVALRPCVLIQFIFFKA
jgi:hypothetical protein